MKSLFLLQTFTSQYCYLISNVDSSNISKQLCIFKTKYDDAALKILETATSVLFHRFRFVYNSLFNVLCLAACTFACVFLMMIAVFSIS